MGRYVIVQWLFEKPAPSLNRVARQSEGLLVSDGWHKGRFLERWAERDVLQAVPDTFSKYALEDVQRALTANLHFYEKFGREVANAFGYDFPEEAYSSALEQLKQLVR